MLVNLWTAIKENWLISLGVIFIVMSMAWFLRYALMLDWLSPQNSVLLLFGVSGAAYSVGLASFNRSVKLGTVLSGLGMLGMLFSFAAGVTLYQLWEPTYPIYFMLALFVATAAFAISYDVQDLMSLVIAGALIMPYALTIAPIWNPTTLLIYYLALAVVSSTLKHWRGWETPYVLAAIGSFNVMIEVSGEVSRLQLILYTLFIQFLFCIPALIRFAFSSRPISAREFLAYLFVSITPFMWWPSLVEDNRMMAGLLAIGVLVIVLTGFFASRKSDTSAASLPLHMTLLLSVQALVGSLWALDLLRWKPLGSYYLAETIEWTGVVLAAVAIAHFLYQSPKLARGLSLFYVLPFLVVAMEARFETPTWFDDPAYLGLAAMFVSTALAAAILWHGWANDPERAKEEIRPHILVGLAVFLGAVLLWDTWDFLLRPNELIRAITLIGSTTAGLALFLLGNRYQRYFWRNTGIFLLIFVALRLLSVEIWEMDVGMRIFTFFCIGLLFLITAFITQRKSKQ